MRVFLAFLLCTFLLASSQAKSLVKEDSRAYRAEGYKLQAMGDLDGALTYYQKAAQMDPHYAQVFNDLGIIYESKGNDAAALEMYQKALEIEPKYLAVYTNLALLYERKGDVRIATLYWKKRYEAGKRGDYWWEAAKQHLLKLGTYPEVRKELLEEKAAILSRELLFQREQERLMLLDEAQLHFDIGKRAFTSGDYPAAKKEFKIILSLNPPDEELKKQTRDLFKETERLDLRERAAANANKALDYMDNGDYLSASGKLRKALEAVSRITQEQ